MPKSRWDERAAAHLLNRAGFGGTLGEIAATKAKGLEAAVDEMIEAGANAANVLAPTWAHPGNIGAIRMEARAAKRNGDASKLREVRKTNCSICVVGGSIALLRRRRLFWRR